MAMKTVLLPLETHDTAGSMLAVASMLSARFGSFIEGVAVRPNYAGFIAVDPIGVAAFPEIDEQVSEQAQAARRAFDDGFRGTSVRSGWSAHEPLTEAGVAAYARVFDITVLGRPSNQDNGPRMSLYESVLFESGRPILAAPPQAPKSLGETVVIAWNQSTETARTIALGAPLLEKAKQVHILCINGWSVPGPSAEDLAAQLKRSGIEARILTVQAGRRTNGEAITEEAEKLGCDLLFKGAYTQSRLRQMVFGGATAHVLAAARMPVLMAH